MGHEDLKERVKFAAERDPEILIAPSALESTLGSDQDYLNDVLGITKQDLKRLERLGLAIKARYSTENQNPSGKRFGVTGPHRTRWILLTEPKEVKPANMDIIEAMAHNLERSFK